MSHKLQEAFGQIHAEEELKEKTKAFLAQKTHGYQSRPAIRWKTFAPVMACLLFLLAGWRGYQVYFTPTTIISIDINPSIEISVNRFDKVLSVKGYLDDGKELAASLHIKYMNYANALDQVLSSEKMENYLSKDEILSIAVVGSNDRQRKRMLSKIESRIAGQKNAYCYWASLKDVAPAHEMGLSYGKYRAFLEVQALDPSITPGEIRGMTMREIRELLKSLSPNAPTGTQGGSHKRNGRRNGRGGE